MMKLLQNTKVNKDKGLWKFSLDMLFAFELARVRVLASVPAAQTTCLKIILW
jgi:hypothetical protein